MLNAPAPKVCVLKCAARGPSSLRCVPIPSCMNTISQTAMLPERRLKSSFTLRVIPSRLGSGEYTRTCPVLTRLGSNRWLCPLDSGVESCRSDIDTSFWVLTTRLNVNAPLSSSCYLLPSLFDCVDSPNPDLGNGAILRRHAMPLGPKVQVDAVPVSHVGSPGQRNPGCLIRPLCNYVRGAGRVPCLGSAIPEGVDRAGCQHVCLDAPPVKVDLALRDRGDAGYARRWQFLRSASIAVRGERRGSSCPRCGRFLVPSPLARRPNSLQPALARRPNPLRTHGPPGGLYRT